MEPAQKFLRELSGGRNKIKVLCAVSGGVDSMCLLHLLSSWGQEEELFQVFVAHFNHQLRGRESDSDEEFVRNWCTKYKIPFQAGRGDVQKLAVREHLSLEEAGRKARYAFLEEQRQSAGCEWIFTAHHADDNAETLLLNLLRGTGLRGLTGIPPIRGFIARPLLQMTRPELEAYAVSHQIPHVEDATNNEDDAARNVLRHRVLPVLRELNPQAVEHMAHTAVLLSEDEKALMKAANTALLKCHVKAQQAELPVEWMKQLEPSVQTRCISLALEQVCGHRKDLSSCHVEAVQNLLQGLPGREISLPYDMQARREERIVRISIRQAVGSDCRLDPGKSVVFGCWSIQLDKTAHGQALRLPEGAAITVTGWHPKDRMEVPGSRGKRSFKRICSERGISPSRRDSLPVLRINGQMAAVPEIGIHKDFLPDSNRDSVYYVRFKENREGKINEE